MEDNWLKGFMFSSFKGSLTLSMKTYIPVEAVEEAVDDATRRNKTEMVEVGNHVHNENACYNVG